MTAPQPAIACFTLPACMTAETAEPLADALSKLSLDGKAHIQLDASHVQQFNSVGAQLLASLDKTVKAAEGTLEITSPTPLFTQSLQDLGLGWLAGALRT